MNILKKELAPVSTEAWKQINSEAKRFLETYLVARKFLKVEDPKGWDYAALPEGRLDIPSGQKKDGVIYGIHKVQPLIEPRISFSLNIWELDNISRGSSDADFDPLAVAAKKLARFEEETIFYGLEKASIKGLSGININNSLNLPENITELPEVVSEGVTRLVQEAVNGPYTMVAGLPLWKKISAIANGYPLKKQIEKIIGGNIIPSLFITEAFLVPQNADELRLVLGQDISIGYESHTAKEVVLYLTESFTFKIDNPSSVIMIK